MTFTQETVKAGGPTSVNVVALACTVGLAGFLVALGLGIGHSWVSWLGIVWLAAEGALRLGVYLGIRIGYGNGQTDAIRQIQAW